MVECILKFFFRLNESFLNPNISSEKIRGGKLKFGMTIPKYNENGKLSKSPLNSASNE